MKNCTKTLANVALVASLGALPMMVTASDNEHALPEGALDLNAAVELALAAVPGHVIEAELEHEDNKTLWEIEVAGADKKVWEIEIDAVSGEILEQEIDDDHD